MLTMPRRLPVPRGFEFSGVACGLKARGGLDLGLVTAPAGATAAALFTSNRVVAAPIEVGREYLRRTRGRVRTVVVNSGNANCATGVAGRRACEKICTRLSGLLGIRPAEVFPSSTGVIGVALPAERIEAALVRLVASRGASFKSARRFARAIMTTDTRPKLAAARFRCGDGWARVLGVAKGAGMIHPRLRPAGFGGQARLRKGFPRYRSGRAGGQARLKHATMLVYLFTDALVSPGVLQRALAAACERTFNRISVDGDTSTNDTVLALASGAAGRVTNRRLAAALELVCASLARQIVSDGEGAGHVVELRVEDARSEAEAEQVARAIAHSPLVKTAWAGADPNWGRILAAIGASGAPVEPKRVDIFFGPQAVCRRGAACRFDEAAAHRYLSQRDFLVRVRLGRGRAATRFWTCDITADYVRVNAHYRT